MKNILIVDDDQTILDIILGGFKEMVPELNVLIAGTCEKAREFLKKETINLLVTDLRMPLEDGYDLLALMTREHSDVPVIVISGYGDSEIEKKLVKLGFENFIRKPFSISYLSDRVFDELLEPTDKRISVITLPTFLQMLEIEKKSCTLKIVSDSKVGFLFIQNGQVNDAMVGSMRGIDAAVAILSWTRSKIEIEILRKINNPVIDFPLSELLLRANELKDKIAVDEDFNEESEITHTERIKTSKDLSSAKSKFTNEISEIEKGVRLIYESFSHEKQSEKLDMFEEEQITDRDTEESIGDAVQHDVEVETSQEKIEVLEPEKPEDLELSDVEKKVLSDEIIILDEESTSKIDKDKKSEREAEMLETMQAVEYEYIDEEKVSLEKRLTVLQEIRGFKGVALFGPNRELLADFTKDDLNIESIGSMVMDMLEHANKIIKGLGLNEIDGVDISISGSDNIFAKVCAEEFYKFSIILVCSNEAKRGIVLLKMNKLIPELMDDILSIDS